MSKSSPATSVASYENPRGDFTISLRIWLASHPLFAIANRGCTEGCCYKQRLQCPRLARTRDLSVLFTEKETVYEFLPARAVTAGPLRSLQRPWRVRWKEGTRIGYIWALRVLGAFITEAIANLQLTMAVWSRVSRRRNQQHRHLSGIFVARQLFYEDCSVATHKNPK